MSIRYNFESASTPKRIPEYIVPEFAEGLNSKRMADDWREGFVEPYERF